MKDVIEELKIRQAKGEKINYMYKEEMPIEKILEEAEKFKDFLLKKIGDYLKLREEFEKIKREFEIKFGKNSINKDKIRAINWSFNTLFENLNLTYRLFKIFPTLNLNQAEELLNNPLRILTYSGNKILDDIDFENYLFGDIKEVKEKYIKDADLYEKVIAFTENRTKNAKELLYGPEYSSEIYKGLITWRRVLGDLIRYY